MSSEDHSNLGQFYDEDGGSPSRDPKASFRITSWIKSSTTSTSEEYTAEVPWGGEDPTSVEAS